MAYLLVDIYEIAVLRILVKKHHPMKVSNLVNGFPDNSEDNVLQAISKLHFLGYISVYDTLTQYISLSKDTRKEVLKIVNPNLNKESQTKQYFFNQHIVNPQVSKNVDETKNNKRINLRPLVQTGTIALAAIVIGSIIATGASLLQYLPMANNQEPASMLLLSHPSSFSTTTDKFQSMNTSPAQEAGLNSLAVATTVSPGGGSFIDNVFVDDDNNTFHRIIIDGGTEKVSDVSTTIYLKNAFVVLKI
ncbi:MAG: hypothetical protein WA667_06585 [Candidatus Nitrosopolaris sp.]